MEAGFKSACDSVSWKADRKLAYGLVKNKKPFFTGPQVLLIHYLKLYKCRLHTYSDRPSATPSFLSRLSQSRWVWEKECGLINRPLISGRSINVLEQKGVLTGNKSWTNWKWLWRLGAMRSFIGAFCSGTQKSICKIFVAELIWLHLYFPIISMERTGSIFGNQKIVNSKLIGAFESGRTGWENT